MKLTSLLASSSLLALAACGGGNGLDARWTDADQAHVTRAFEVASGTDHALALIVGIGYASAPASAACPSIAHSGAETTVTGGCRNADGTTYSGTLHVENAPTSSADTAYDPTLPTVVTFEGFGVDDGTSPILLDGEVVIAQGTITTALDATYGGIHARGDMTYTFDTSVETTTAAAGSTIDVDGVGSADVSGTWSFATEDQNGNVVPARGSITLAGAETLAVDLSQQSASGCYAATIDGASGRGSARSEACVIHPTRVNADRAEAAKVYRWRRRSRALPSWWSTTSHATVRSCARSSAITTSSRRAARPRRTRSSTRASSTSSCST